jgi:hypothetical protein
VAPPTQPPARLHRITCLRQQPHHPLDPFWHPDPPADDLP